MDTIAYLEGRIRRLEQALLIVANQRLLGRSTSGTGAVEALEPDVVRSMIGAGTGSGSVTSVGLSLPGVFTVSGSPVTTSGTLTGTLATQAANVVWAGPTSGGAAAPTFRALVEADIPTLSPAKMPGVWHSGNDGSGSGLDADTLDGWSGGYFVDRANHTGTQDVSTITGTVPVNQGGTGLTSYATGDLIYASGATTLSKLAKPAGVSHGVLVYNNASASISWVTGPAIDGRTSMPQLDSAGSWVLSDFLGSLTYPLSSVCANSVKVNATLFLPLSAGAATAGSMYFNYSTNTLYVHNGTAWRSVTLT